MKMKLFLTFVLLLVTGVVQAERIKDLASIAGVRSNQLIGYGLVVGLDGTGDKTKFTGQSLRNMLVEMGINIPPGTDPKSKNVAAVSIHADLPPFVKPGQKIDVTVSSLGDAKSLRGGSLLMTPLKGADGNIYAMAQGNLVVGGFGADAADGSRVTVNIPSAGRVPNGATVERTVKNAFNVGDHIILNLHNPDFTTVSRLTDSINHTLGKGTARSMDASSVKVNAPRDPSQRVPFLSLIENLELNPGEAPAKVVVNSRSGTVVIGQHVRVSPAAVTHGNLSVTISADAEVSQPDPLSQGQTVITPNFDVEITEEDSRMFVFDPGVSLDEIVRAVNQVGAAPGDLVAILEALKQSGALRAELVVI
ncbi:flagellar basal body P-ring protein FlgI [uncultured Methylophaga sp.]|jgi:flagellar P-ring protein precursor FlgI|uniref:flagellar basal body P-ring protein FlgI n=1 Tax=uncultured Methylophaga sp. TaxID=285271 RepID=UPI0026133367|nr:flagellar basal body P-ring protein FlgI [uncultured Methylophaga sp.]